MTQLLRRECHFLHVLFMGLVPFSIDRRGSPVASRSAFVSRKWIFWPAASHIARGRTGTQAPARERGQRHSDVRQADTGDVVSIGVGFRNQGRRRRAQKNRRDDRQDANIAKAFFADPDRVSASESFKAMEHDVAMFGRAAFDNDPDE